MSRYTTQMRFIVEMNSSDTLNITERITQALPRIFNFPYPIWDESHKRSLERKIVMRYFNKEICEETVGLWKLYLEERLNSIMPYYVQLHETTITKYKWLENVDDVEEFKSVKVGNGSTEDMSNGSQTVNGSESVNNNIKENNSVVGEKTSKNLKSDLPQSTFTGIDYGTELQDNVSNDNSTNVNTSDSSSNSLAKNESVSKVNSKNKIETENMDNYTRSRKGNNGARSKTDLNMEYRQSIINIDNMIVDALKDLFMLIY